MNIGEDRRIEGRLGRRALTDIGRQLGAMYEKILTEDVPEPWRATLQRLSDRYEETHAPVHARGHE